MGAAKQISENNGQPSGSVRAAAIAAIWIVAFVVGFFVIPYHDVFAGYHHEPPDLFKPLVFGVLATMAIGWGLTYLFSDQLGSK